MAVGDISAVFQIPESALPKVYVVVDETDPRAQPAGTPEAEARTDPSDGS